MTFNLISWSHPHNVNIKKEHAPVASLQHEMNRLFDDFFGNFDGASLLPDFMTKSDILNPAVDIAETAKALKIDAELPGMELDDIEVTINDNYLTITGKKEEEKEDKESNYVRRERSYGSYQRTISLPETVNGDKAQAHFKKGVLSIEIPKKAEAVKPSRKLDIKHAA